MPKQHLHRDFIDYEAVSYRLEDELDELNAQLDEARSLACDVALFQVSSDGHLICSVCGAIGEIKNTVEHESDCKIGLWRDAKDGES
jgi:hypothetical protein